MFLFNSIIFIQWDRIALALAMKLLHAQATDDAIRTHASACGTQRIHTHIFLHILDWRQSCRRSPLLTRLVLRSEVAMEEKDCMALGSADTGGQAYLMACPTAPARGKKAIRSHERTEELNKKWAKSYPIEFENRKRKTDRFERTEN